MAFAQGIDGTAKLADLLLPYQDGTSLLREISTLDGQLYQHPMHLTALADALDDLLAQVAALGK